MATDLKEIFIAKHIFFHR